MNKRMKSKNYGKILRPLFLIMVVFIVSVFILKHNPALKNSTSGILSDEFILNFLGLFVGLVLAIISIFYVNIQKIKESIPNDSINDDLMNIFRELKENSIFILFSLIVCFALIILRDFEFDNYE